MCLTRGGLFECGRGGVGRWGVFNGVIIGCGGGWDGFSGGGSFSLVVVL